MSHTALLATTEDGKMGYIGEFKNSHRGSSLIFTNMRKQYLHVDDWFSLEFLPGKSMRDLWNLFDDQNVKMEHRIVLGSTYDMVMIKRENLQRMIDAYKVWVEDFGKIQSGHVPKYIEALEEIKDDENVFAICWAGTSVSGDIWDIYDKNEGEEDEYEESRLYDITKDEGHWFLFDEVKDNE